jgi:hypothetical protein
VRTTEPAPKAPVTAQERKAQPASPPPAKGAAAKAPEESPRNASGLTKPAPRVSERLPWQKPAQMEKGAAHLIKKDQKKEGNDHQPPPK